MHTNGVPPTYLPWSGLPRGEEGQDGEEDMKGNEKMGKVEENEQE